MSKHDFNHYGRVGMIQEAFWEAAPGGPLDGHHQLCDGLIYCVHTREWHARGDWIDLTPARKYVFLGLGGLVEARFSDRGARLLRDKPAFSAKRRPNAPFGTLWRFRNGRYGDLDRALLTAFNNVYLDGARYLQPSISGLPSEIILIQDWDAHVAAAEAFWKSSV